MLLDDVFSIIKNDSQCELATLVCHPLSPDTVFTKEKLSKKLYESLDWQLQEEPSLISVSAFYGSVRCFNVLLTNGANLNLKDKNGVLFPFLFLFSPLLNMFLFLIDFRFILQLFRETCLYSCR